MIIDKIFTGILNFILFGLTLGIGKILYKKDLKSYLIHSDRRGWKLFVEGLILGCGLFLLYPIILLILGVAKIEIIWENLPRVIPIVLASIFAYIAVSLLEETFFRGCVFLGLLRKYSFKIAIVISSIIFGALHFFSYSSTTYFWIGLINAGIIGVLLCITVVYTDSLMLAIGYHLSWNLTQSLLLNRYNFIINIQFKESILTGSAFSPEAGLLVTFILIIMYIYIIKRLKPKTGDHVC